MTKMGMLLATILLLASGLWACASSAGPAASPPPTGAVSAAPSTGPKPTSPPSAGGTNAGWDELVAAAKTEGLVEVYNTAWTADIRTSLNQVFKDKYGISVEFSPFARGAEMAAKIQAEQGAGLYMADIYGAGATTMITLLKPAHLLGKMEPLLVLPEVIDPNAWMNRKIPFIDQDRTFIAIISSPERNIFYNTTMIKKGEIVDYSDVLKPQYKGKITLNDPTVSGSGSDFLTHLVVNLWDMDRTRDFLRALLVQQGTVIERDNQIHVEAVARGKYPLGLAPTTPSLAAMLNAGAPLDVVYTKEGVRATTSSGSIGVPTKMAHPNAGKLFLNWLLSAEGQALFSKAFGSPSTRLGVSASVLNPILVPQPGEKIYPEVEEFQLKAPEVQAMAKQVIAEASK